ncbi:hypothetical protein [Amycolatopsis sp. lyj-84]|uniref:hypothetical protein n=1 Tax=Amycolatopsis sp. lyj-84 TaxID=2789284 RepID=UPI00397808E2
MRTLAWVGGTLYDVAAGWRTIPVDGSSGSRRSGDYGQRFDAVKVSPRGDVVALLASTGTDGLLLTADGEVIREIGRSDYQADAYRYPLELFTLPDGRTGLVHCPDEYNRLEIEDAVTGEHWGAGDGREPSDFFHSRLAVSSSGRYLLSAGWAWHPVDCVMTFDLRRALTDPGVLDSTDDDHPATRLILPDISGACFIGDDVAISTSSDLEQPTEPDELAGTMLARWSMTTKEFLWRKQLDHPAGDLVCVAGDIMALYGHPRLYDGNSGELLAEWPELATGHAESSIVWGKSFSGPARIAVDNANRRFAVTDGEDVTIVHLG